MGLKTGTEREQSRTAVLARRERVDVADVSRKGCRFRGAMPMDIGEVGMLTVDIGGLRHIELFRVARSGITEGGACESAVEFLPMPAGTRSLHDLAAQLDDSHST